MSDDDVDQDLLAFMRKALGLDPSETKAHPTTKVLESALYIFDNSIDVALDRDCVMQAAETIYDAMQKKAYGTSTWSEHELHPQEKNEDTLNFIFTMDVLNFSFWSGLEDEKRFSVDYGGKRYTGYWSLVALLRRALDEGLSSIFRYRELRTSIRPLDSSRLEIVALSFSLYILSTCSCLRALLVGCEHLSTCLTFWLIDKRSQFQEFR